MNFRILLSGIAVFLLGTGAKAEIVFSNDFSSGLSSIEAVTGAWTVADGYVGNHGLSYTNNELDTYSIQFDAKASVNDSLSFDINYATETGFDFIGIKDNGNYFFPEISNIYYTGYPELSGVGMAHYIVPLEAGLNNIVFSFHSDGSVTSSGVKIDNVAIASPVPEPASWAMMIGGIGLAGGMIRRGYRKSEERFTAKVRATATA